MSHHILKPITVKALAIDDINRTLGLSLKPGKARMSAAVHEKIATKHASDYGICLRHLDVCCARPTYVGVRPKHPNKIELVLSIEDGGTQMLVALGLERDRIGDYGIASAYCVPPEDVARWLRAGNLKTVKR